MDEPIIIEAPDGSPPRFEFETLEAWLAAMPAYTVMLVTRGDGPYRATVPALVEDLIDGFVLAPQIDDWLRRQGLD